MKKITYNNKQYVLNDPQYPVEETVTDTDMNEIKEVVNFNADETLEENIKIKEQLEQTKDALINITTEKSSSINVQDSSNLPAKVNVFGNSTQNGEPTPETPVEIQNVGDNINLFNKETATIGARINYADGTTTNNNGYTASDYIEVEELEIYYCNYTLFGSSVAGLAFYDKNKTFLSGRTLINQITAPLNARYIRFCFRNDDFEGANITDINTVKFEKGNKATSYSEYGCGNIDITVCNKNWFKILSEINKTYITVNNNNTLTINGTIAQNESFAFSRIRLKKGTYTFSLGDYSKITNCYYNIRDLDTAEVIKNFNYADTTVEIDKDRNIELTFVIIAGTYNNVLIKPQVEVENKATSWVEHKEQLITFPLAEGQKLADGDYLASDGIHHVRDVYIFKAVTSLSIYNDNKYGTNVGAVNSINTSNILSDRIVGSDSAKENTGYITGSGYTVVIYGNPTDTVESFNEKFVGTKIEYPLAKEKIEPYTEEQQEAYNKLQNVLSYKTETNVFTDNALLEFKYVADTQTWTVNLVKSEIANTNQQVLNLAGGN